RRRRSRLVVNRIVELPEQERDEAKDVEAVLERNWPVHGGLVGSRVAGRGHQPGREGLGPLLPVLVRVGLAGGEPPGALFPPPTPPTSATARPYRSVPFHGRPYCRPWPPQKPHGRGVRPCTATARAG